MTALVKYEAARAALAEARTVDEVKDIRDKAEAMRAYARMAKDRELEINAAELRIRSERRLGAMLNAGVEAGQLKIGRPALLDNARIKLKELGIDKELSSRAQRTASTSQGVFEKLMAGWRARSLSDRKVTVTLPTLKRERVQSEFAIDGGDVRLWSVARARRIKNILTEIIERCGDAGDGTPVGDCISDPSLRSIIRRGERTP